MSDIDIDQHMRDIQKEYLDFLDDDVNIFLLSPNIFSNLCYSLDPLKYVCSIYMSMFVLYCNSVLAVH